MRSPPKSCKKAEVDRAVGSSDAELELDAEANSFDSLSQSSHYESYLSVGLDCAMCDLVSLDSQVDEGIFLKERRLQAGFKSSLFAALHHPKAQFWKASFSFPLICDELFYFH